MPRFFPSALCALAAILAGCATPAPQSSLTEPKPQRSQAPYAMAALDEARLKARDGTTEVLTVGQDGTLVLESGPVRVAGMPVEKFRALVRRNFPDAAAIEIVEFRTNRVSVLGEVFHQIHTDLGDGPMRVMDAIAAANGFTPLANKRRVRLIRQNAGDVEVYELDLREMMQGAAINQNLLLNPGDVITVPRNFL